jgi:hypothetical protein
MRAYGVVPLPPFHTWDGPTNTSAVLTAINPLPDVVLGANFLESTSELEFKATGRYTSTATPGTVTIGVYLSPSGAAIATGHALVITAAIVPVASQTNRTWRIEGGIYVRSIGTTAGATSTITGAAEVSNITSNGTDLAPATAPFATLAYDNTLPQNVRLGMTASVATGSWLCHAFRVRSVN